MMSGMPLTDLPPVRGLLLAAGEGRRMGGPKALVRPVTGGPTFVESAVESLLAGGCDGVTVVVGAAADEVTRVVGGREWACGVEVASCPDWAEGMGASLRAGLTALSDRAGVEAVLVTLVDLPDVGPDVIARLLTPAPPNGPLEGERVGIPTGSVTNDQLDDAAQRVGGWRAELRRAAYGGKPGHPALIGRNLWDEVVASAVGDRGAREVYRTHPHLLIECGDLATGRDVDTRAALRESAPRRRQEGPPFRDRAR
jgi:nicotine blue oxidoreductase